jgi:hypothetical protein
VSDATFGGTDLIMLLVAALALCLATEILFRRKKWLGRRSPVVVGLCYLISWRL